MMGLEEKQRIYEELKSEGLIEEDTPEPDIERRVAELQKQLEIARAKQSIAEQVLDFLSQTRDKHEPGSLMWLRIDGEYEGAVYMLAKLSRKAREKIAAYEHRIIDEEDMETQVILARKRDATVALANDLGLNIEDVLKFDPGY